MSRPRWISRTIVGILLATFFSDVSHEMCTAVLPLYLASVQLGPAALGMIEGLADLLVSLSKLAGGVVGHHVSRKRPWAAAGYLVTTLATGSMAFANRLSSLVTLRTVAWSARGFRSPLRDYLLADTVDPAYFGRVYGLERAGDMFGAVLGPLVAAVLVWWGVPFQTVILWTLLPGMVAAASMWFLIRERPIAGPTAIPDEALTDDALADDALLDDPTEISRTPGAAQAPSRRAIPRAFWFFLVGVLLFGLGDFSRTFLIYLAATALGATPEHSTAILSLAMFLYMFHNLVSAAVAYPIGALADRRAKLPLLIAGYGLGVATNIWLALFWQSLWGVAVAVVMSGIYIAVEETLEKAVAAEFLSRETRSLGFGILASSNALGDMVSSVVVGLLLAKGQGSLAFALAGLAGAIGVAWFAIAGRRLTAAAAAA